MRIRAALILAFGFALAPIAGRASPADPISDYRLRTSPEQIFFTTSNPREKYSGSIFFLIFEATKDLPVAADSLDLIYKKAGTAVRNERLLGPLLQTIDVGNILPNRLDSPEQAARVRWPHAFRLYLSIPSEVGADMVEATLNFSANGQKHSVTTTLPVRAYRQKTALIFPFRGNGIISVGGALASGHRNRSGLYAIDALGLNPTYGPMVQPGHDGDPKNYAGWGREILAPAGGTIVVARNDHVDQPVAENSDPAYYDPKYPDGGDPGNLVVIDHGNGEFSMIAHMQKGTVRIKVGDRVTQGQVLGLMGNSGDTSGPHVHYQLQNGPDWERSDALPFQFTNVSSIARGNYFEAK